MDRSLPFLPGFGPAVRPVTARDTGATELAGRPARLRAGHAISPPPDLPATGAQRVCLILESAGGGAGRHVLDVAEGLAARGDSVTLIFCPRRAESRFLDRLAGLPGLAVHRMAMGRSPGPRDVVSAWQLARLIRRLGPFDIVHSHSTKAGLLARLVPVQGAARVHTPHAAPGMNPDLSRPLAGLFDRLERWLSRHTDRIIAVSGAEARHLRRAGIASTRLAIVVNGVGAAGAATTDGAPAGSHADACAGATPPHAGDNAPSTVCEVAPPREFHAAGHKPRASSDQTSGSDAPPHRPRPDAGRRQTGGTAAAPAGLPATPISFPLCPPPHTSTGHRAAPGEPSAPHLGPEAPHLFGFVGRIVPQKGADRLLHAFAALPRRSARLVVVGDGPGLPALRALAHELGIARQTAFVGSADSDAWYPDFDTLVLPSRYEAMPYVLLEAEAAGLPIVATDVAGTTEVVSPGQTGLIVANDDSPAALAAAMTRCLDPTVHAGFRAHAARRRGRHSQDAMLTATREVYRSVQRPRLQLYRPRPGVADLLQMQRVCAHAAEAGIPSRRISLRGILQLRPGDRLLVQATGLRNLVALPLARWRGARTILYLPPATSPAGTRIAAGTVRAGFSGLVRRLECRLAHRLLTGRPDPLAGTPPIVVPIARTALVPPLLPAPARGPARREGGDRRRILYLAANQPDPGLAAFAAAAPALAARGYRPTLLTRPGRGRDDLLPVGAPEVMAIPPFSEVARARIMADTLCLWNPMRDGSAGSRIVADAIRFGVAALLTDPGPADAALIADGLALDWDTERRRNFSGLAALEPERVAGIARRLFDDRHGHAAFRRDWLPWLS